MKPYYEEKGITIYNADCREILPSLPKVDLVLTDPPYGIGEARGKNNNRGHRAVAKDYGVSNWDDEIPSFEVFQVLRLLAPDQIIWGGNYFVEHLTNSSCWLVWDKCPNGSETDFADCELAWTNLKGAVRRFKWLWSGYWQHDMSRKETRVHPTQKPLPLMKWCISLASESQTILDPFMGSGTTLRAAKDLGRQSIGIEIEERYCEIAANRLRQEVLDFQSLAC